MNSFVFLFHITRLVQVKGLDVDSRSSRHAMQLLKELKTLRKQMGERYVLVCVLTYITTTAKVASTGP